MNERIHEIALDCYEWVGGNEDGDVRIFDYEKFAELIVRECVEVINCGIDYTDYYDVDKSIIEMRAQMWCRDAIKQHFGVK